MQSSALGLSKQSVSHDSLQEIFSPALSDGFFLGTVEEILWTLYLQSLWCKVSKDFRRSLASLPLSRSLVHCSNDLLGEAG